MIDSHAHLDGFLDRGDLEAVVTRAQEAGLEKIISIGVDAETNLKALRSAELYPDYIHAVVGYDRDLAGKEYDLGLLEEQLELEQVCGLGEIGLDYYHTTENRPQQIALFEVMLECALKKNKPVVIHSRSAEEDSLSMLGQFSDAWDHDTAAGVLHCFTGDYAFAKKLLDIGFLISFSGIATFKNAEEMRTVAKKIPLESLLIETDSPYLAPHPFRGKENEPCYVKYVADVLATARGIETSVLIQQTMHNTKQLFKLS